MSKPSHRRSGSAEDAFDAAGPGLDHGTTLDSGDDPRRRSGRGSSPAPSYRSAAGAPSVHALHARKDTIIAQSLASRSRAARGGAASPSSSAAAGHGVPGGGPPRRPLLGPYPSTARGVRLWKNAVLALALWSVLETPYRNAFWGDPPSGTTPGRGLFWAALAVDLAFCADVVLRGALFLPDSAPRRAGHGTVLRAYARAQLWVDLLAALPLDVVATAAGGGRGVAFALGCTKVLRWQRLLGAFARAERDVAKSYYAVRGGRLLVLMVYHLHVFACSWYLLATQERDRAYTWFAVEQAAKPYGGSGGGMPRYLVALYWATTTFSTAGYGDVVPELPGEMIFTTVYMVINILVAAYVIGNVTEMAMRLADRTRDFRERYRVTEEFVACNRLPHELAEELRSFQLLAHSAAKEHPEALDFFPPVLQCKVSRLLNLPVLDGAPLLAGCSAAFVDALACALRLELFLPGCDVVTAGDASAELMFVASGTVRLLAPADPDAGEGSGRPPPDTQATMTHRPPGAPPGAVAALADGAMEAVGTARAVLGPGGSLGEVPFLFHMAQPLSGRTAALCRVLALRRGAWDAAASAHPRSARAVCQAAASALAAACAAAGAPAALRAALEPVAAAARGALAAADSERTAELCLAAGRGDVLSLRRALAAGAHASAVDYDGRSALHVAAAKGASAAVRYLVDHGADANSVDNFGNSPLFEAALGGHDTAAAMLRAAGASLGLAGAGAAADAAVAAAATAAGGGGGGGGQQRAAQSLGAAAAARRARDAGTLACGVCSAGDTSFLRSLLRNGLPPGAADYDGRSGLHLAAAKGHGDAVAALLSFGADPNAADHWGTTPLLEAVRAGHDAVADALVAAGGALGAGGAVGQEACAAAARGDADALRRLLRHGCPPGAADYDRRTAAHLACAEGRLGCALVLAEWGADFGAPDRWGHTPLGEADRHGFAQLAAVLRALAPARAAAATAAAGAATAAAASAASASAAAAAATAAAAAAGEAAAADVPAAAAGEGGDGFGGAGGHDGGGDDDGASLDSAGSLLAAAGAAAAAAAAGGGGGAERHVEGLPAPRAEAAAGGGGGGGGGGGAPGPAAAAGDVVGPWLRGAGA